MTSSSSFVRNVIAVPCLPARPVRPARFTALVKVFVTVEKLALTDTMDICLDGICHLEVDYQSDVLYINTTTGQIGGDKDVRVARTQSLQRSFSLFLILAGVQCSSVPLKIVNRELKRQENRLKTSRTPARWRSLATMSAVFF